jgi:hypothetical protein
MKPILGLFVSYVFLAAVSANAANFSGNYSGTWAAVVGGTPDTNSAFIMTAYQTGETLNGIWMVTGQGPLSAGQLTGTVSGDTANVSLTLPAGQKYRGVLTGTVTLARGTLVGAFSGVNVFDDAPVTATLNLSLSQ